MPLLVVGVVAARPIAELLTGFGPDAARRRRGGRAAVDGRRRRSASSPPGLLASALAALDDYVVPALGYIVGSVAGLALIVVRIDESRHRTRSPGAWR